MDQPAKLNLQMLTPLWTAGAAGKCDRLHETGIIGSMRWWYEVIMRGLGSGACDPTSEGRCKLSGKERNIEERYANLCPVCRLFGCGGWQRRFRLVADVSSTEPFLLASLYHKKKTGEDESNRWWLVEIFKKNLNDKLAFSKVALSFYFPANIDGKQVQNQIESLLSVMAHCGSIGAKGQYGFGQFEWEDKVKIETALQQIETFVSSYPYKKIQNHQDWYSLDKFWFINNLKIEDVNPQIKNLEKAFSIGSSKAHSGRLYLPVSFDIRYKLKSKRKWAGLRQAFYKKRLDTTANNKELAKKETKQVFGKPAQGSRVFVSHPNKSKTGDKAYNLRVWGFAEESVAKVVQEELKEIFNLMEAPEYVTGQSLIAKLKQEVPGGM